MTRNQLLLRSKNLTKKLAACPDYFARKEVIIQARTLCIEFQRSNGYYPHKVANVFNAINPQLKMAPSYWRKLRNDLDVMNEVR